MPKFSLKAKMMMHWNVCEREKSFIPGISTESCDGKEKIFQQKRNNMFLLY
jgi:hypothetical protein